MPQPEGSEELVRSVELEKAVSRRRFLASLGVLGAAGALAAIVPGRHARHAHTVQAGRPALGTWMRAVARDGDEARANRAIAAAFRAVDVVDAQMSVHRADSELSRVNAFAGRGAAPAGEALRAVVAMACEGRRRSGGAYDPAVLPLMKLYGFYGAARDRAPGASEVDAALRTMGADAVRVDGASIALAHDGAGLDLGSIGKGWAVDRAIDAMRAEGVRAGLVDLGGNVYAMGTPEDGAPGWSVGVFHPVTGALDRTFVLRDAAVATSGNREQARVLGGLTVGHLFDARRGLPANGHLSVSVVARTGVESDLGSTAAYVLGPDRFRDWPGITQTHWVG